MTGVRNREMPCDNDMRAQERLAGHTGSRHASYRRRTMAEPPKTADAPSLVMSTAESRACRCSLPPACCPRNGATHSTVQRVSSTAQSRRSLITLLRCSSLKKLNDVKRSTKKQVV